MEQTNNDVDKLTVNQGNFNVVYIYALCLVISQVGVDTNSTLVYS